MNDAAPFVSIDCDAFPRDAVPPCCASCHFDAEIEDLGFSGLCTVFAPPRANGCRNHVVAAVCCVVAGVLRARATADPLGARRLFAMALASHRQRWR